MLAVHHALTDGISVAHALEQLLRITAGEQPDLVPLPPWLKEVISGVSGSVAGVSSVAAPSTETVSSEEPLLHGPGRLSVLLGEVMYRSGMALIDGLIECCLQGTRPRAGEALTYPEIERR